MVAMVALLFMPRVDLATCSSCNSPCPLVADGCGRGAVDFALTSVAWSVTVATDHATAVSSRGGERWGYGCMVIRK